MFIKCVDNRYHQDELTMDKTYKVTDIEPLGLWGKRYEIINDIGKYSYYREFMFTVVDEND